MQNNALYIKVADHICDKIIRKDIKESFVLKPFDWASEVSVSIPIVMEAFDYLISKNILLLSDAGYSLSEYAFEKSMQYRKNKVLEQELLQTFELLTSLTISEQELLEAYQKYLRTVK